MRIPVATYRLQVNEAFTLDDATAIVPYLARLGVSDLYVSPIFEARPDSAHGYDVTDPTRVRESIGGAAALRRLAGETQRHGMGILLDIVPNHMAASVHNPWWLDVLRHGRASRFAGFFDIDWGTEHAPRRLRLPILGDGLPAVVERGELTIDTEAGEAVYFETRLPLAPGTLGADAALLGGEDSRAAATLRILERQHYEPAFWRTAGEEMNYRRFFDITDLAGVRVEDEDVFHATHALIRSLAAEGTITGLRIDHIDGLRDPRGYLDQLRRAVRGPAGDPVYTVVEKILAHDERLPADWACEGTTGYEFLNLATALLLQPDGYARLEQFYARITGDDKPFGELVREKKLLVVERLFGSEANALGRSLAQLTGTPTLEARRVVAEVTASMGVYRTYIRSRHVTDVDRARIEEALADAGARHPDLPLSPLRRLLLEDTSASPDHLDWILRWQQFTGPVMAKGFEDTALYCHNVLLAANEVGSDPVRPALIAHELHALLEERRSLSPRSLNATATHDTKRGEDTRARIAVLSEVSDEWRHRLRSWIREGEAWKAELAEEEDTTVPGADVDSLLYQTLVGAWPGSGPDATFMERIKEYMTKAVREAKEQTSWRRPDEDYEQALASYIEALMAEFGRAGLADDIQRFSDRVRPSGAVNSLTQLLLKVTAPGIPDIYQGTELWSFTLVDPDNRRAVDYDERRALLDELAGVISAPSPARVGALLEGWADGRIKLLLTALALQCRRRHADTFDRGDCAPLPAHGARADHIFAYARRLEGDACIVVLPRWTARLGGEKPLPDAGDWAGTTLRLPMDCVGDWRDALTGATVTLSADTAVPDLFATLPFALLERG